MGTDITRNNGNLSWQIKKVLIMGADTKSLLHLKYQRGRLVISRAIWKQKLSIHGEQNQYAQLAFDPTCAEFMMVEVKHDGDVAALAEGQQVPHRKGVAYVIILQCQARLAIVAQLSKVLRKPIQRAELVAIHTTDVDVDLVPVAGFVPHQVQNLQKHRYTSTSSYQKFLEYT